MVTRQSRGLPGGVARRAHGTDSRVRTSRRAGLVVGRSGDRGRPAHRAGAHHDARGRRGRGDRGPHLPGDHRAALPGEPGQSPARRSPSLVNAGRITGIADLQNDSSSRTGMRIVVVLRRDAVAEGGAEQPVQAHPAAGHVRRQHGGAGRRRPPDAAAGLVRPVLGGPPGRGDPAPDALPARRQGPAPGPHPARLRQGPGRPRRGDRPDPWPRRSAEVGADRT